MEPMIKSQSPAPLWKKHLKLENSCFEPYYFGAIILLRDITCACTGGRRQLNEKLGAGEQKPNWKSKQAPSTLPIAIRHV